MNKTREWLMMVVLSATLASTTAVAATPNVMCATVEVTECVSGLPCDESTSVAMAIPPFLRINFEERTIRGKRANDEELVTEIVNVRRTDDGVVLQGIDEGLGWTMSLSEADGSMSLAVSGDLLGYVIFGNCMVM